VHDSDSRTTDIAPDITLEVIGLFLQSRGWQKVADSPRCFSDSQHVFGGILHWTAALEIQFDRDHKATAAAMTRGLAAMAGAGASL